MNNKTSAIVLTAAISALVGGGMVYCWQTFHVPVQQLAPVTQQNPPNTQTQATQPTVEQKGTEEIGLLSFASEERETFYGPGVGYVYQLVETHDMQDQALLRKDRKTNKIDVIYKSIKTAFPELKNRLLKHINVVDDKAIFQTFVPESDGGWGDFYAMDLNTYKLEKMKINEVYKGSDMGTDDQLLMDDKIIYAQPQMNENEGEKLYLLDLKNDSSKVLATLPADQSFIGGKDLSSIYDLKWITDTRIRYAIFDKKKGESLQPEDVYKALIKYEELDI